jgi:hypothetical protein
MAANRSRPRQRLPAACCLRQQILETLLLRRAEGGRITVRPSRPHVVASATCYTLRLHVSAAPPRVGLTQALGGRKTFVFIRPLLAQPLRSFSLRCRL